MTRTFGEVGAFHLQNENHNCNSSYVNKIQFTIWLKLLPELRAVFRPTGLYIYLVFQFQEKRTKAKEFT